MKILSFVLLALLTGCINVFDGGQEGRFKTDQEMIDFLATNIDEFTKLAESKEKCNEYYAPNGNDLIRADDCKPIISALGLIYVHHYSYYKSGTSNELVERMVFDVYRLDRGIFNEYIKGYYFYYNSTDTRPLWDGDLNTRPPKKNCENYYREIEVLDRRIPNKWYLYSNEFCD